ncbi:MAG: UMP kinase [Candidatus Dasytiphilus stammeri]
MKVIYKRILLKISGQALQGSENFGIDKSVVERIVQDIKELVAVNVQVAIVIGGGNIFRGQKLAREGMDRVVSDYMGMLATVMNGLALLEAFNRTSVATCMMSAIPLTGVCEYYRREKVLHLLQKNYVVILSAGTGNALFTTDTAACLRGIEIGADVILKATQVEGVFSSDPVLNHNAILYKHITYQEVIKKELQIMDFAAFTLARDNSIPIRVFNINKIGVLQRIISGQEEGTLITTE